MEENSSVSMARRVLIGRIETLAIGQPDAALTFEGRLAADNGWTEAFAARVAHEYRRFIALAALSDEQLTPPDAVDQAWHLHMVYTRDYWQTLCRDIVGRDIHHEPTSGGPERREHYSARYAHTLDRYRATFNAMPPTDIWPDPSERFSGRFQRVDLTRIMLLGAVDVKWIGLGCAGVGLLGLAGMSGLAVIVLIGVAIVLLTLSIKLEAGTLGRCTRTRSDGCTMDVGHGDGSGADSGCGGGCGCG